LRIRSIFGRIRIQQIRIWKTGSGFYWPLVHILSGPRHWQYPFSAIHGYWGPAIQSERGWEYIIFLLFFIFFPMYWQDPFPCHPQVPGIASVALAEKGWEYYITPALILALRTDSTFPLSFPRARGNTVQSGKGWEYLCSAPCVGSAVPTESKHRGLHTIITGWVLREVHFFYLFFFIRVPMYWQFLLCFSDWY